MRLSSTQIGALKALVDCDGGTIVRCYSTKHTYYIENAQGWIASEIRGSTLRVLLKFDLVEGAGRSQGYRLTDAGREIAETF